MTDIFFESGYYLGYYLVAPTFIALIISGIIKFFNKKLIMKKYFIRIFIITALSTIIKDLVFYNLNKNNDMVNLAIGILSFICIGTLLLTLDKKEI